jgi:acetylornithine/N-succinyldiaminopimelate aminotransferase
MLTNRQIFLNHLGQTSPEPLLLEIVRAEGVKMFDSEGHEYLDLISGISVSNVGHCHPKVVEAVQKQAATYMHLMVYGELVQSPQVMLAQRLTSLLPDTLNSCYFVNSGSEAIEGAMKLAKRVTGRHEIIAFNNAYHGSTQGALSIIGSEYFRNSFRPLLPSIRHLNFNRTEDLEQITENTACVVTEIIRGEAGAEVPLPGYLKALEKRCRETGAMLVVDEIQSGFRRTGPLMAFMTEGITPDILVLAKGMGGGMPIGAFIAEKQLMDRLTGNPVLGHITTFGGHPVSCAAALAALSIVEAIPRAEIERKSELFRSNLVHEKIVSVSGRGLLLAVEFSDETFCKKVIAKCIENGIFTDWFLFAPHKMRIAPPLIISDEQILKACQVILESVGRC